MSVGMASGEGLHGAMVDQLVADHADKGLTMRPEVEAALRAVPRHLFARHHPQHWRPMTCCMLCRKICCMSQKLNQATERRAPLPLTARDIEDLAKLRKPSPEREALSDLADVSLADEVSEALLIHAVFTVGLRAIWETAEAHGYAQLAAQKEASGQAADRQAISDRRAPWADED